MITPSCNPSQPIQLYHNKLSTKILYILLWYWWWGSCIGVAGIVADSTGVSPCQLDVAVHSPLGTPRVLDHPVVISHSCQQHSVVELSSAVVENASSVLAPVGRIDSHRNRSAHKGIGQIVAVVQLSPWTDLEWPCCYLASLLLCDVGVLVLVHDSLCLHEGESVVHLATVACQVAVSEVCAVHKHLLWKILKIVVMNFGETLQSSHCRESPTRSAGSLILHVGHSPSSLPIDITQPLGINTVDFSGLLINCKGEVGLRELFLAHCGKLIECHGVFLSLFRVVLLYLSQVVEEDCLSVPAFGVGVDESVLLLPKFEVRGWWGGVLTG